MVDRHDEAEHDDDRPVGRLLSRREVVRILGVGGAAAVIVPGSFGRPWSPVALPACVARPEMVEGPYFVPDMLQRSDITTDSKTGAVAPGAPLALAFNLSQVAGGGCTPLRDATVDMWQCNALGRYSGFSDARQGFGT